MVPPKFKLFKTVPAAVILNGQDILPVNESWAILLTEFINRVNEFGPHEMGDEVLQEILQDTYLAVRKVYPEVDPEVLQEDLETMVEVFEDVAAGRIPNTEVGLMSIGDYAPFMRAPHRMDLMVYCLQKSFVRSWRKQNWTVYRLLFIQRMRRYTMSW